MFRVSSGCHCTPSIHVARSSSWSANDPLDRLDEAVLAPAGDRQSVADPIHALMVMRRARQRAGLRHGRETAPRFDRHLVDRLGALERHAVLDQSRVVGQMLEERPAERDVHHLHASADAERRHGEAVRRSQQRDLELVPVRLDPVEVLDRFRSVPGRVDVATADEEQGVERLEELFGGPLLAGSDDRRSRARPPKRVEVRAGDAVPPFGPPGDPIAGQVVGDDRDQGSVSVLGHGVECSEGPSGLRRRRRGS